MIKRAIDVALSATVGVIASPVLICVALLVRVVDGSPVLFMHERIGRDERLFNVIKFRTMQIDAKGPSITSAGDKRVTRLGRVLRATKLDELPQLWNILVGDMSIVGPRPEVGSLVAEWPSAERSIVLTARPGLTDLTSWILVDEGSLLHQQVDPQLFYRQVLIPFKVCIYVKYVQNRNVAIDAIIVAGTILSIFSRRIPVEFLQRYVAKRLGVESCLSKLDARR